MAQHSTPVRHKHLYFCHKLPEFLAAVDRDRGRVGVDQETVVVADTGQDFTKLSVVRIDRKELEGQGPCQGAKEKKRR